MLCSPSGQASNGGRDLVAAVQRIGLADGYAVVDELSGGAGQQGARRVGLEREPWTASTYSLPLATARDVDKPFASESKDKRQGGEGQRVSDGCPLESQSIPRDLEVAEMSPHPSCQLRRPR